MRRNVDNVDMLINSMISQADKNFNIGGPAQHYDPTQNYDPSQGMNNVDLPSEVKSRLMLMPISQMAQLNVVANRATNALANKDLPFAVFGYRERASNYSQVITVPSGLTLTVSQQGNDTIRFSYTDGTGTDYIDVTCPDTPYTSLLIDSAFDRMIIAKMRYSISDATKVAQFRQPYNVINNYLFGNGSSNKLNVQSYKTPEQNQNDIVDVNVMQITSKNTTFVNSIGYIASATNFSITMSFFVPEAKMFTAAGMM